MRIRSLHYAANVVYTLALIYGSLMKPSASVSELFLGYVSSIIHFAAYLILSCLWYAYTLNVKSTMFISLTLGFILEIIQYFLPFREFSFLDILGNVTGSIMFLPFKRELMLLRSRLYEKFR